MSDPPDSVGNQEYGFYSPKGDWVSFSVLAQLASDGADSVGNPEFGYYDDNGNWISYSSLGIASAPETELSETLIEMLSSLNPETAETEESSELSFVPEQIIEDESEETSTYDPNGDYSDVDVLTQLSMLSQEDHDNFFDGLASITEMQSIKGRKW